MYVWAIRVAALVALLLGLSACSYPTNTDPMLEGRFAIEGRALETSDGYVMGFPGSRVSLTTIAMDLKVQLIAEKQGQSIDVQIEGGGYHRFDLRQGRNSINLTSLYDRSHVHRIPGCHVKIVRRDESWQGTLIFVNATSSVGFRPMQENYLEKTKLLFIGDSITAGAGTQSRLNDQGEREAVSNARVAYPRVLGERLNTQVHQIAYGGRGVVRDWQGITDTNNAPQFYDRVLPDNPDHLWDAADYQADIVSVMLGTNDFNPGIPDRESWTRAYKDFVARIRNDYPKAQVFLISSPMTGGEKGEALKAYVKEVANSFDTTSVKYLEVSQYHGQPWDSHPTADEHEEIATELEPFFRAALAD